MYITYSDLDEGLNVLRVARKDTRVPADNPTATKMTQLREKAGGAPNKASRMQDARDSSQLSRLYSNPGRNYFQIRQCGTVVVERGASLPDHAIALVVNQPI